MDRLCRSLQQRAGRTHKKPRYKLKLQIKGNFLSKPIRLFGSSIFRYRKSCNPRPDCVAGLPVECCWSVAEANNVLRCHASRYMTSIGVTVDSWLSWSCLIRGVLARTTKGSIFESEKSAKSNIANSAVLSAENRLDFELDSNETFIRQKSKTHFVRCSCNGQIRATSKILLKWISVWDLYNSCPEPDRPNGASATPNRRVIYIVDFAHCGFFSSSSGFQDFTFPRQHCFL